MSLGNPRRFQVDADLDRVRRALGWTAPESRDAIRAGSPPLGVLRPGEFVLFVSYISCGFGLPLSSFFMLLLEDYGLQLQHLTPTPSSRCQSSYTCARCLWGCDLAWPSSITSLC